MGSAFPARRTTCRLFCFSLSFFFCSVRRIDRRPVIRSRLESLARGGGTFVASEEDAEGNYFLSSFGAFFFFYVQIEDALGQPFLRFFLRERVSRDLGKELSFRGVASPSLSPS